KIGQKEIDEAAKWGKRLSILDYEELIKLLRSREKSTDPPTELEKDSIRDWSVKYALALFDQIGLDRVYSGEQWRVEMYEHLVRSIEGFKLLGSVQSFDYKYFTKGAIVSPPKFIRPIHLDEFKFVQKTTKRKLKVPLTGPYTVVDWSFNEFYETEFRKKTSVDNRVDIRR